MTMGQSSVRFGVCCAVLFLGVLCCGPVEALFFDSFAGLTADIMRKPLETISLFALKSYLMGHVGGRVTQYRQMMYNQNNANPYAAASFHRPLYVPPRQGLGYSYVNNARGRRSLEEEVVHQRMTSVEKDTAESVQFLEIAYKLDTDKCIPRLVCEVMSGSRVTQSGQFEDLVVSVLGDEIPTSKGDQKLFASIYHYAAYAGKQASSVDTCQQLFSKCKATESEFRKIADKIFSGIDTNDDDNEEEEEDAAAVTADDNDDEVEGQDDNVHEDDQSKSGERQ